MKRPFDSHSPQRELRDLLDKKQLSERLNLPSTRMVDEMMRRRKISFIVLGHRTIRFDWTVVQAELLRFEKKAVQ